MFTSIRYMRPSQVSQKPPIHSQSTYTSRLGPVLLCRTIEFTLWETILISGISQYQMNITTVWRLSTAWATISTVWHPYNEAAQFCWWLSRALCHQSNTGLGWIQRLPVMACCCKSYTMSCGQPSEPSQYTRTFLFIKCRNMPDQGYLVQSWGISVCSEIPPPCPRWGIFLSRETLRVTKGFAPPLCQSRGFWLSQPQLKRYKPCEAPCCILLLWRSETANSKLPCIFERGKTPDHHHKRWS